MNIIGLIVWLLVLGILYAIGDYVLKNLIPEPPQHILRVALVVLIGIAVILLLLDLLGVGGGLSFPRLK
jgi:uncharacterized membrane protein